MSLYDYLPHQARLPVATAITWLAGATFQAAMNSGQAAPVRDYFDENEVFHTKGLTAEGICAVLLPRFIMANISHFAITNLQVSFPLGSYCYGAFTVDCGTGIHSMTGMQPGECPGPIQIGAYNELHQIAHRHPGL